MAERTPDEIDRLVARSISAQTETERRPVQSRRRIWPWVTAALLFAFILGLLGSPWLEHQVRSRLPGALPDQIAAESARIDALEQRLAGLESAPSVPAPSQLPAPIDARLGALESHATAYESTEGELLARVDALAAQVEQTSGAVAKGDAQLRDLFLLAVTRRMFEAGRPLGPSGTLLSNRYKAEDAAAVEALQAWSAAPQSRESLAARLRLLSATADETANAGNLWDRIKAGLSRLATVRDDSAAPDSAGALAAAQRAIADDDIGLAVAALGRAPMNAAARQWVADANLLAQGETALLRLENRALQTASEGLALQMPAEAPSEPLNAAPQNEGVRP